MTRIMNVPKVSAPRYHVALNSSVRFRALMENRCRKTFCCTNSDLRKLLSPVPLMGAKIRFLMLGGTAVNANALLRFYVLHCVILPLAAILFIAVHFWRIRKDGGIYAGEEVSGK